MERMKSSQESLVIAFAPKQYSAVGSGSFVGLGDSAVGKGLLVATGDWLYAAKLKPWIVTMRLSASAKFASKILPTPNLNLGP